MKTRIGFVSNSSSSSFIFALKEKPSAEDIHRELWDDSNGFGYEEMALHIFHDLQNAKPLSYKELLQEFTYGWFPEDENPNKAPQPEQFNRKNGKTDWLAYSVAHDKYRHKLAEEWINQFPDHQFYQLEYSDHDGVQHSQLEHEVPWYNWKNVFVLINH